MKKAVLASMMISLSLLGACSQVDENTTSNQKNVNGMNHSSMNMNGMNMNQSTMNMNHGSTVVLKSSLGVNELTFPNLLKPDQEDTHSVSYTIHAQQGSAEIFDGMKTNTYGYNGDFLGPVLRVKKGMNVTIHLVNDLKEDTTFHWHGLELPAKEDGGPHQVLKPGESKTIRFTVQQDAATLWFHPHPMGSTAKQVYKGLSGLFYIDDHNSDRLNIPKTYGENDFPLILQDKTFTNDKQLDYDKVKTMDGTAGDTLLINGVVNPKLTVDHKKVRLRILNGSNMRNYKLHFDNNMAFEQIASDGGFLNKPNTTKEIEIAPGERIEIIVDLTKVEGNAVTLVNEDNTSILPIHLKNTKEDSKTANVLNNLAIPDQVKNQKVTKTIKLAGMGANVTINGQKFDANRIDFKQKQNETEVWEIENVKDMMGGMKHPFHIHGTQFQVISIDGKEPPANLAGLKDTISLQPGQKAKIAVTFTQKGIYMFHCHILEHEDNGMMGQVKVY